MKSNPQRRDRVVFISLVDILLQLLFVLLIVILYVFNDYQRILVINQNNETCSTKLTSCEEKLKELEKVVATQKKEIDEFNVGNLIACIPASTTSEKVSLSFNATSQNSLVFTGFSPDYIKYLEERKDNGRQLLAGKIAPGTIFPIESIEKNFGFVRQSNCYHVARVSDSSGVMPSKQIDSIRNQVRAIIRQRNEENHQ